ncbi:MAG: DUF4399 domain-containing protein [Cyanobacteria bacterium J06621_11]
MSRAFSKVCRVAASLVGRKIAIGKITIGKIAIGTIAIFSFLLIASPLQAAPLSHADESAYTYIISPTDGQTVSEAFTVKFGLSGMGVAPAGIEKDGTGHHHLLIDVDELPSLTEPLPATAQIRHFGGGQTEATIELAPGDHTLQLLLGNYTHVPHDNPVLSEKIKITVQ